MSVPKKGKLLGKGYCIMKRLDGEWTTWATFTSKMEMMRELKQDYWAFSEEDKKLFRPAIYEVKAL